MSFAVTSIALVASSLSREIWQLSLTFGLVVGLGSGHVASVLGPTVATRWVVKDRGLVTGMFGAAGGRGGLTRRRRWTRDVTHGRIAAPWT